MGLRTSAGSWRPGLGGTLSATLVVLLLSALLSAPSSGAAGAGAAAPAAAADCGPTVMRYWWRPWRCTFADDFTGSALDYSKWTPMRTYATGVPTPECRVDEPQNIRVSDGTLQLTARSVGRSFYCETRTGGYWTQYTGGGVSTHGKFDQAFGRWEVRAKFPHSVLKGLHSAIWTWPINGSYGHLSGELDIVEWRSGIAERAVPTVHYQDTGRGGDKTNWHCYIGDTHNFHTYAMEWNWQGVTFLYDGQECLTHKWSPTGLRKPKPFDEPFFLILNQSLGIGLNAPDANTELPATMAIDYVRVWS